MASAFGRLNYNFDDTKYGSSIYLTTDTKEYLNTYPLVIKTWQKNDIANGNIQNSNYFKNPLSTICDQLSANVNTFSSLISTIVNFDDVSVNVAVLLAATTNLKIEIINFKSHTSNVSGLTKSSSSVDETNRTVTEYPDYQKSTAIGQLLLQIVNATDSVLNSTPVLGSMTSLFIGSELSSNLTTIQTDTVTVNNSIRLVSSNLDSNLTSSAVNTIISHFQSANTILGTRREHDWNFYRNAISLVNDYNQVNGLGHLGNTQIYLVNNLIGTNSYITNIAANT